MFFFLFSLVFILWLPRLPRNGWTTREATPGLSRVGLLSSFAISRRSYKEGHSPGCPPRTRCCCLSSWRGRCRRSGGRRPWHFTMVACSSMRLISPMMMGPASARILALGWMTVRRPRWPRRARPPACSRCTPRRRGTRATMRTCLLKS